MQFDRSADGTLTPLPKPSVDTGAGLERISAVMQGEDDNFHTDLFLPLLEETERLVGQQYGRTAEGDDVSFRVLADHARAVSFLLADGVYPSNEGRGYVLRRILRRAVRHAWLLGRREPTLDRLTGAVARTMGKVYPELHPRRITSRGSPARRSSVSSRPSKAGSNGWTRLSPPIRCRSAGRTRSSCTTRSDFPST